jgi:hypothetical protein
MAVKSHLCAQRFRSLAVSVSLQAIIVVICTSALMLLVMAAFKIRRKVYGQQIA